MDSKFNLINHYRKLWFFNFHRTEGNNVQLQRDYFARIFLAEIEEFFPLQGKSMLDVGGARGEYAKFVHETRGGDTVNLEPQWRSFLWPKTVQAFANDIPFSDHQFDLVICRGVMEHVPTPVQQLSVNEMYRVMKPGGFCYVLIPPWYNPHAGHSLKPFHIFPFPVAKFLRQLVFRKKIVARSFADAGLYPITFGRMRQMMQTAGFDIVATRDTHFRLHFMTRIPFLREILVPAVAFIATKKS
jgi:SAM-dependent methyltransferase